MLHSYFALIFRPEGYGSADGFCFDLVCYLKSLRSSLMVYEVCAKSCSLQNKLMICQVRCKKDSSIFPIREIVK